MTSPAGAGGVELSVVIPAYNEEQRLGRGLASVVAYLAAHVPRSEILVVDDGSTDGTARVAASHKDDAVPVSVLPIVPNRGKGHAVRAGMLHCEGMYILMTDADLSTPIEELPLLLEPVKSGAYDIAIGSRGLPESRLGKRQPWARERMGRLANLLVRSATGTSIMDTQCGFKLFRRDVAHHVFALQRGQRFAFDAEVLFIAERAGYRILEVPVTWNNALGSKVRPVRDALRSLYDLVCVRVWEMRGAYSGDGARGAGAGAH